MVKKLGILGIILVVVTAASLVWAGGAAKCAAPKLVTTVQVKMKYPAPPVVPGAQCGPAIRKGPAFPAPVMTPPIPVAVPMWKFIVPWPPYVYYLPVE